jgi:hypothetical protein
MGPTCDDDARLLNKWAWFKNIWILALDKGYYSVQHFYWIDLEFWNQTELVSWFLELWTGRYEFSKFKLKFKPELNRKGISIFAMANGLKVAMQPVPAAAMRPG